MKKLTYENMTINDMLQVIYNKICVAITREDLIVDFKHDVREVEDMLDITASLIQAKYLGVDYNKIKKSDVYVAAIVLYLFEVPTNIGTKADRCLNSLCKERNVLYYVCNVKNRETYMAKCNRECFSTKI
mgnify:CR=1 FL=1